MAVQLEPSGLEYEFVEAVEGRDLDPNDSQLADQTWRAVQGTTWYAAANLGAALSHLSVYRKVLEDGHECALVLEDDVTLPPDILDMADAAAACMSGAEVVLLLFSSPRSAARGQPFRLSKRDSLQLPSSRLLAFPVNVGDVASACAYLISREACERMSQTVLPVRADSDRWEFFWREGAIDRVRCVVPMPVVTSNTFRTTIDPWRPGGLKTRILDVATKVPALGWALMLKRKRRFATWFRVEVVDEPAEMKEP